MGYQPNITPGNMKAFMTIACALAAANSAPQFLAHGAGQVSHQSVSKPFQGEHRSTVQSKAFGAGIASVSDAPNRPHGARGVVGHPVAHAVHAAPLLSHAPVVHAAPVLSHAPVVHAAHAIAHPVAGYAAPDLAEVSPYSYNYAVADDYSGAAFNQAETSDGTGVVEGSYSVNLPDGRIQHVNYHANDYDGLISEVTYEGTAAYPEAIAHGSVVSHAIAHPVAHAVAHPIAHAVAAPLTHAVAHPVAHAVAAPLAHGVAHPFGHAVSPLLG